MHDGAAVEYERTLTRREQLMYHVLQMVLGPRNATLVLESLYGHEDRFRGGADDPSNMENKLTATRGDPLEGVTLECALAQPLPPVGALVYPRFRVATLALPDALEFHVLGEVVHCGVDARDWFSMMGITLPDDVEGRVSLRGAWGADGRFYPWGFAITDWWAEYDAERRRRYQRRQRARQRGMHVFGGPVMGDGGRYGGLVRQ